MARRIVSLLPAATELVAAIGLEGALVGRSHECDYPPRVQRLPVVTHPRIPLAGDSRAIDRDVNSIVRQALSVYEVDVAQLQALQPDYVITQTQCDVCAVSLEEVKNATRQLTGSQPQIVTFEATNLNGLFNEFQKAADVLGRGEKARQLVERMRKRMDQISDQARNAPVRPNVLCLEWLDPLMAAGNWIPTLVEMAGGVPLLAKAGKHSPHVTWQDIAHANPDQIILMPCGFDIERTGRELAWLHQQWDFRSTKAFRAKQVYVVDGNAYFNRPGPRLLDSLEILAEIQHPKLFGQRRLGHGWVQYF